MRFPLCYPLTMSFKIVTFVSQFTIHDAHGGLVAYVRQKLFKLREAVTVFADEAQSQPLYTLQADRILDWSARYQITTANGRPVGVLQRRGMKSLWKAHYDVFADGDEPRFVIRGESGWVTLVDGIFGEIPLIGMLSGYLFHPAYLVSRSSEGPTLFRLEKQPAFFEGRFTLEKRGSVPEEDEERIVLGLVMLLLLERDRG
jgi:hypothetical protein